MRRRRKNGQASANRVVFNDFAPRAFVVANLPHALLSRVGRGQYAIDILTQPIAIQVLTSKKV
jgi:hypothetical protein